MNNPSFSKLAGVLEGSSNGISNRKDETSNLLVAWDATMLPVRASSIDCVISDLPFGQQCLSLSSLNQILPLIFSECARVLQPGRGRMILLCGGGPKNIFSCINRLSGEYFKRPASSVLPVSVGGLLAWIIRVDRNEKVFAHESDDAKEKYLCKCRKIANKRDEISRLRKTELIEQQTGKGKRRRKSIMERDA